MGPRQDAGEDFDSPVTITVSLYKLQWGPGRMPGKT